MYRCAHDVAVETAATSVAIARVVKEWVADPNPFLKRGMSDGREKTRL